MQIAENHSEYYNLCSFSCLSLSLSLPPSFPPPLSLSKQPSCQRVFWPSVYNWHEDVTARRTMFGFDSSASKRTSRRTNSGALVPARLSHTSDTATVIARGCDRMYNGGVCGRGESACARDQNQRVLCRLG